MKDDTAAILMLNSFLNKSSTSNSLVPGCYHIHIQTKFFFIAGLRNLVDRNKSCFSIPKSQYFFPWRRHITLLSRKLLMKLLFLMMKITLTQIAIPTSSCGAAKELVSSKHFRSQRKRTVWGHPKPESTVWQKQMFNRQGTKVFKQL